jgi:hypothetical protein
MATIAVVAKHIKLSERHFKTQVDAGIYPRAKRGEYDLEKITHIRIDRLIAAASGRADSSSGLTEQRTRQARATANRAERKDRTEAGELVSINDMVMLMGVEQTVIREHLLSMAGELQGEIGVEATTLVDNKAREILTELSEPDNLVRRAAYTDAGLEDLHNEAIAKEKDD